MIDLSTPMPLEDAIAHLSAKTPIGSILRSAEWAQMPLELRMRSQFSAGIESVRFLCAVQDTLETHVRGLREQVAHGTAYVDRSSFIGDMKKLSKSLGLAPGIENPQDLGTLKDITSATRLGMIFDIQTGQARGFAHWKIDQDPDVLNAYPAQELVRLEARRVPRAWRERWAAAGGKEYEGRMIALCNDPVWSRISRFGTPWPPFDFQSGMGLRRVPRRDAESLGLLQPGEQVRPIVRDFNDHLAASVHGIPPAFQLALKRLFGDQIEIADGQARWVEKPNLSAANENRDYHGRWTFGKMGADTGAGLGGNDTPVNPLNAKTPITANDAARLMSLYPRHPVTLAFKSYFKHKAKGISTEQGKLIDSMLRRLPPFRPSDPIFRGLTSENKAAQHLLATRIQEHGVPMSGWVNPFSVNASTAVTFAESGGPGVVLVAVKVNKSARDLRPLVATLAPDYRFQGEIAVLKGTKFRVLKQDSVQLLRHGATPFFTLEEVSR